MLDALTEFFHEFRVEPRDVQTRLRIANEYFHTREFSRSDYLQVFKTLSAATASRDLAFGVIQKVFRKKGDRRKATYRFRLAKTAEAEVRGVQTDKERKT